jgi:hypothetical protein
MSGASSFLISPSTTCDEFHRFAPVFSLPHLAGKPSRLSLAEVALRLGKSKLKEGFIRESRSLSFNPLSRETNCEAYLGKPTPSPFGPVIGWMNP